MNQDGFAFIFGFSELETVDVNKDGPSLTIEASPPPLPPGHQIAKDVLNC